MPTSRPNSDGLPLPRNPVYPSGKISQLLTSPSFTVFKVTEARS